jgi:hypothetical protein
MKKTRHLRGVKVLQNRLLTPGGKGMNPRLLRGVKKALTLRVNRLIDPHCQRGASTTPLGKGAQSIHAPQNLQGLKMQFRVSGVA